MIDSDQASPRRTCARARAAWSSGRVSSCWSAPPAGCSTGAGGLRRGCSRSWSRWRRCRSSRGSRSRCSRSPAAGAARVHQRAREPGRPTGAALCGRWWSSLWLVFRRTRFGVGCTRSATTRTRRAHTASACGATKVGAYVLSGVFAAAGGLFLAATTTAGDATSGDVFILTSIAAVVLGGDQLLRRAWQRGRRHRRRVHPDAADQRAVLRRHRPAVPVVLPGPVPGGGGAARDAVGRLVGMRG